MSVRVEFYDVGGHLPVLRVKGEHWNPDADEEQFTQVAPGVVEPADPDDEVPTDVALTFSGNEAGVLMGTVTELREWVNAADLALAEHEEALAEALGTKPCPSSGTRAHSWELTEDGYLRTWITTLETDEDGTITGINAAFSGTESFSESGDGHEFLQCMHCPARRAIPDDVDVDYY